MLELNDLESAVLSKLLAGEHPLLEVLRNQLRHARLANREYTGAGFYCELEVDSQDPIVPLDCALGDVHAELDGVANGAGFVLFIRDGRLSMLEGYTYDEPWPALIRGFSLNYVDPERKAELAKLG